jgi:hypothetical protein
VEKAGVGARQAENVRGWDGRLSNGEANFFIPKACEAIY